jgi:hypothetical protein
LFYEYSTGGFSSRKMKKATYETLPFQLIAGGWRSGHDTAATSRKSLLPDITDLIDQVPIVAGELGLLKLGHISMDGRKIHADAYRSHAVSHSCLLALARHSCELPVVPYPDNHEG